MKKISLKILSAMVLLFAVTVNAQSQGGEVEASAPDISSTSHLVLNPSASASFLSKGFFDFYSESSYYYDYDFVTDSRLRYYQPLRDLGAVGVSLYLGANIQYQSPGAIGKYYDNTVNPNIGLQLQFVPGVKLQTQIGYRSMMEMDGQDRKTTWDPRMILSAGRLWMIGMSKNFGEGYLESSFVPRLDRTPVTLVWWKQGYRWFPHAKLTLDAYGEIYQRVSNSNDLGPAMTEWRAGGRTTWTEKSWNVSALVYHPFQKHVSNGELEGLLALGGQF